MRYLKPSREAKIRRKVNETVVYHIDLWVFTPAGVLSCWSLIRKVMHQITSLILRRDSLSTAASWNARTMHPRSWREKYLWILLSPISGPTTTSNLTHPHKIS